MDISLSLSLVFLSLTLSALYNYLSLVLSPSLLQSLSYTLSLSIFLTGLTPTKEHLLTLYGWVSLYGWPSAWQIWIQLLYLCWMIDMFGQIQTSQTEGQPYSNTYPFKVSECCLLSQTRVSLSLALLHFSPSVFHHFLTRTFVVKVVTLVRLLFDPSSYVKYVSIASALKDYCYLGSGCGVVGRVVPSDTILTSAFRVLRL